MTDPKTALVFFSATDVTGAYARVIQKELIEGGAAVEMLNVTPYSSRQNPLDVARFDSFIFGFPVYSDLAPSVINTWLATLDGQGKRCATFFTYGGRTSGYAHFHTHQILEKAGFQVLLSAEFLGRHTYNLAGWNMLSDRPGEVDFEVAREFARLAIDRFSAPEAAPLSLQKPFGYPFAMQIKSQARPATERRLTQPVRTTAECGMCRTCETECPNQAFNADTGLSDIARCIDCQHCVYACPEHVIHSDERMRAVYANFLKDWNLSEEVARHKQSKIISAAWQAAS